MDRLISDAGESVCIEELSTASCAALCSVVRFAGRETALVIGCPGRTEVWTAGTMLEAGQAPSPSRPWQYRLRVLMLGDEESSGSSPDPYPESGEPWLAYSKLAGLRLCKLDRGVSYGEQSSDESDIGFQWKPSSDALGGRMSIPPNRPGGIELHRPRRAVRS